MRTKKRDLIPFIWRDRNGRWSCDTFDGISPNEIISAEEFIDERGQYCLATVYPSFCPEIDPEPFAMKWEIADVTRNSDDDGGDLVYWWDATDG